MTVQFLHDFMMPSQLMGLTLNKILFISKATVAIAALTAPMVLAAQSAPENLLPDPRSVPRPAPQTVSQPAPRPLPGPPASTTAIQGQPVAVAEDAVVSAQVVQAIDEMATPAHPKVQYWTLANAQSLLTLIDGIDAEGLSPGDYQPAKLRAAIASGEGAELNDLSSQMFAWVVEDLRDGRTPMKSRKQWFVLDPDQDRYPTGKLMADGLASGDLSQTLKQIMPEHPDYYRLRDELEKTPSDQKARRTLIRANMDRWRWLARDLGNQYLITNVPEYQLRLTVNDKIVRTYRTVVGKPGRTATPQIAESVEGVIFNPTWTVPQSIVKGEGLGARVLGNPAWARLKGYKATKGNNGWVSVVQQPGPTNSLGLMKLDMPNKHAIFLHDTPSRRLFKTSKRALSHGCIRTERATELAITLAILRAGLTADEAAAKLGSGKYTKVGFKKQMPVYITYFTMAQDIDGKLKTFSDIYGRDKPVLASFDKPRVANRARVTGEQVIVIEDDLRDS